MPQDPDPDDLSNDIGEIYSPEAEDGRPDWPSEIGKAVLFILAAGAVLWMLTYCAPAKADECITPQAVLLVHGDALIERLPWPASLGLLAAMSALAEPPRTIRPSTALAFRLPGNGVRVEFFDENNCGAFGASFSAAFYADLRFKMGTPA